MVNYWNERYEQLREQIGSTAAVYCLCAVLNITFVPEIDFTDFEDYRTKSKSYGNTFEHGITDMNMAVSHDETEIDRWKSHWGIGDPDNPYTDEDYNRLDTLFNTFATRLQKAGGMDALQEDTLRVCSKMRLMSDRELAKGTKESISNASTLNKMIEEKLSSEQLRKKDAKPIDQARIDSIVDVIQKKSGVGAEITLNEAMKMCADWLVSHHYDMTMDAADKMLLSIINCTRENSDLPPLTELPDYAKLDEANRTEFNQAPDNVENDVYGYLGMSQPVFGKVNTKRRQ